MATFSPSSSSLVETVVHSGWRRRLFVVAVQQLAFALAIVFAGAILMLLLGTQILDWYWLLLLAAIGTVAAALRIRRRLLARYAIAQLLDQRLDLSDSLSTAWYLRRETQAADDPAADDPVARAQLAYAEQIAARIRPVVAFPMAGLQAWALTGVMAATIFGLFTLRYFVNSSLSLRPALVPIHFGETPERAEVAKAVEKKLNTATRSGDVRELSSDTRQESWSAPNQKQSTATNPKSDQNANTPASGQSNRSQSGQQSGKQGQESESNSDKQDSQRSENGDANRQSDSAQGAQQQKGENRDQNSSSQQPSSQGLLDKMKDALSGMMAKMHSNSGSQDAKQEARNSPANKNGQNQGTSQKDDKAQSQSSRNGDSSQDAQATAQASATEKAQSAAGASSDEKAQEKGSDPQSGAGRQDGEKGIKDAEQLKAMGKLAEIIGKRSASVTGEMSVEKPSGPQQLQTQYSDKLGRHADLGGEINRDQVPLEYQQYVREYMNQVHKQANQP